MCANDKGKQINKQQGAAHAGVQMQGAVWLLCNLQSPLHDASEYVEGLWRCSEKHGVQYTRSYSDMASTWRRHALWLQTLGDKPSSLDTCGLPITIQRSTGLTRVSPCLDAPLSVEGSQAEVQQRMTDWNPETQSMPHSFPLSGKNITLGNEYPITAVGMGPCH